MYIPRIPPAVLVRGLFNRCRASFWQWLTLFSNQGSSEKCRSLHELPNVIENCLASFYNRCLYNSTIIVSLLKILLNVRLLNILLLQVIVVKCHQQNGARLTEEPRERPRDRDHFSRSRRSFPVSENTVELPASVLAGNTHRWQRHVRPARAVHSSHFPELTVFFELARVTRSYVSITRGPLRAD